MTATVAIMEFFGKPNPPYRKVDMAEMKALSWEERQELGEACAAALGATFDKTAKPSTVA